MEKYGYKILCLCACLLIFVSILFGCSVADKIEEGTYVCKTPYIKYTEDLSADYHITQEIEIDKKVYKAFAFTDVFYGISGRRCKAGKWWLDK